MIKIVENQKNDELILKPLYDNDEISKDILFLKKSEIGDISFFGEKNAIYIYFGDKGKLKYHQIFDSLKYFFRDNKKNIFVNLDDFENEFTLNWKNAVIESMFYGNHKEFSLKTTSKKTENDIYVYSKNISELKKDIEKIEIIMSSVNLARDLSDSPPNICTPIGFTEEVVKNFKEIDNLKITILDKKDIEKLNMGLFLSVAQGSCNEPRVLIVEYLGDKDSTEKIAMIGKGITMDTGGYALKPVIGQRNERYDMCGAASVISSMQAIAKLKPKKNVIAIAALSENLIGGNAILNSSIVKAMNGLTVEIVNTDAEGRMVMADCITYAVEKMKATKIITVATLTGAMITALGKYYTGIIATDDNFYSKFKEATQNCGERLWRMPIDLENYSAMKESKWADLNNSVWIKYNPPGNAAAFLDNFTNNLPYLYIDIAGSAYIDEKSHGIMVKSIIDFFLKGGE